MRFALETNMAIGTSFQAAKQDFVTGTSKPMFYGLKKADAIMIV
jgi:hypothetical protein